MGIKGTNFVYEKGLTKKSMSLNSTLKAWLNQQSMEERAQFVDALFTIIQATGAKTIGELSKEKLVMADKVIKTYINMDTFMQSHLKKTLEMFFDESQKTLRNSISDEIDLLLSKRILRKRSRK